MRIPFQSLPHIFSLPAYQTEGSSGLDIYSAEDCLLLPGKPQAIATGFAMEIPQGYEAQVRPRSSLALKHSIILPNSPGTIDSDYRGEVKVILLNLDSVPYKVQRGDRIAQLVVMPVECVEIVTIGCMGQTARGHGGFGSTGQR